MSNDNERIYWLAWSQVKGIGPILLKRIQNYFGSLEQAWRIPVKNLQEIHGIGNQLINNIANKKREIEPEQLFFEHKKKNPLFCTPSDPEYPHILLEIPDFPLILYYSGDMNLTKIDSSKHLIAMVGTRKLTDHGRKWTYNISSALAKYNFTVVSGVAKGIDTIAHRGCLDAGGHTIGVLGNGLDVVYPSSNHKLYEEISSKGLLLSEYPAGTKPNARHFPARNRIVAGLCRATLVIEAPEKSGALITARLANEYGRDVYTLPNSPDQIQSRGCLRLIHKGAEVIITEHELLSMLGAIPSLDKPQQLSIFSQSSQSSQPSPPSQPSQTPPPLPPIQPQLEPPLSYVYEAIASSPTPFDIIVEKSGLNTGEVSSLLLQLELEDLISSLPGMCYQKK